VLVALVPAVVLTVTSTVPEPAGEVALPDNELSSQIRDTTLARTVQ